MKSDQQEGVDIFSGFRNWWQDNVTNNQRLMGFAMAENEQEM